jgi:hypothetical protein
VRVGKHSDERVLASSARVVRPRPRRILGGDTPDNGMSCEGVQGAFPMGCVFRQGRSLGMGRALSMKAFVCVSKAGWAIERIHHLEMAVGEMEDDPDPRRQLYKDDDCDREQYPSHAFP